MKNILLCNIGPTTWNYNMLSSDDISTQVKADQQWPQNKQKENRSCSSLFRMQTNMRIWICIPRPFLRQTSTERGKCKSTFTLIWTCVKPIICFVFFGVTGGVVVDVALLQYCANCNYKNTIAQSPFQWFI